MKKQNSVNKFIQQDAHENQFDEEQSHFVKQLNLVSEYIIYILETITFTRRASASRDKRTIYVNVKPTKRSQQISANEESVHENVHIYPSNAIYTTKYNLFTFIPKNLFEQFRRLANFYFLALVVLQTLPQFNVSNPFYAALPITFIVIVTAAKDAFEDWRRRLSDRDINKSNCRTLQNIPKYNGFIQQSSVFNFNLLKSSKKCVSPATVHPDQDGIKPQWGETKWKDVQVGDFIYLTNNESIPADILILSTSETDSICYIETKNLDGESNLKLRTGLKSTSWIQTVDDCLELQGEIDAEPPNINLYQIQAAFHIHKNRHEDDHNKTQPIAMNQILLRGSTLRNTKWIIGVVIYTGVDTKVIINSGKTPSKRSRIEKLMNAQVLQMLVMLIVLCVVIAIGFLIVNSQFPQITPPYLVGNENSALATIIVFCYGLIMLQNFVPISLYVTSEIVKGAQAFFIWQDLDMYFEPDDIPCVPKTWTIADDLGQIEYIFSDKTGTLTRNIMEFRKCSINGKVYGGYHTRLDDEQDSSQEKKNIFDSEESMVSDLNEHYKNPYADKTVTFVDPIFVKDLFSYSDQSEYIEDFFTHLAICHTVISETSNDEDGLPHVEYKAQSPDEAALVSTAKNVGFTFLERIKDDIVVDVLGKKQTFTVLEYLEFNSNRKRMSVIVRRPDGKIYLYCKGADNVIMERCKINQDDLKDSTNNHLEQFGSEGLRTLCLAKRELTDEEYEKWQDLFDEAATSLTDRERKMDEVSELIERDMVLLGATAIEDRLQEGVPECISRLSRAGIKIWVLTGDKMETAINIGFSCSLLKPDSTLIVIKSADRAGTIAQISAALRICFGESARNILQNEISKGNITEDEIIKAEGSQEVHQDLIQEYSYDNDSTKSKKFALVIDGPSLKFVNDRPMGKLFIALASKTQAVICCRVSPKQKAQMVELVQKRKNAMSLSIGDGANDVSMIQKANVGVGISGKEGMQAVMSSDYAIAQFRYLNKLLLVHGRWAYFRIANMALLMFYKNIVWTMVLFWYQIYCRWSSAILYDYLHILFYNLFYTGLPPIIIGAFDRDINARMSLKVPEIYSYGVDQKGYNYKRFFIYVADGVWQSLVCYYGPYFATGEVSTSPFGYDTDKIIMGTIAATSAAFTANFYMGLDNYAWTWISFFSYFIGFFIFIMMTIIASFVRSSSLFGINAQLFGSGAFWFTVPLCFIVSILPRYLYSFYQTVFNPSDVEILREMLKYSLVEERNQIMSDNESIKNYVGTKDPVPYLLDDNQNSIQMFSLGSKSEDDPGRNRTASSLSRLSQNLRNQIVEPLRRSFQNLPDRIKRTTSILAMRDNAQSTNRGFAFSQEPGIVNHFQRTFSRSQRRNTVNQQNAPHVVLTESPIIEPDNSKTEQSLEEKQ